jgi:hypothetical protein
MNKYDKALQRFTNPFSSGFTAEPHVQGSYIIATNKFILIKVKKELVSEQYSEHEKLPPVDKIIPPKDNCSRKFDIADIIKAVISVPQKKVVKISGILAQCDDCGGSGYVNYQFEAFDGQIYEKRDECPVCKGRGSFPEAQLTRDELNISINDICFNIGLITTVVNAIDELGFKSAKVTYLKDLCPMHLILDDGTEILITSNASVEASSSVVLKRYDNENN